MPGGWSAVTSEGRGTPGPRVSYEAGGRASVLVSVESPFPPDILIICSQRTNSVRGESNLCDGNDLMTQQRLGPALAECESPSSNNLSQLSVRKTSQVAIFPFPFSRSVQSLCTMSVSGL